MFNLIQKTLISTQNVSDQNYLLTKSNFNQNKHNQNIQPIICLEICHTVYYKKSNGDTACGTEVFMGMNWTSAFDFCTSMGGRLPVIETLKENEDFASLRVRIFLLTLLLLNIYSK